MQRHPHCNTNRDGHLDPGPDSHADSNTNGNSGSDCTPTPTPTPNPRLGSEQIRTNVQEVDFKAASTVWVYGSGFAPGEEVYLLIVDSNGTWTDITPSDGTNGGGSVYPLVANDQGAWATMWTLGRFTRSGVGAEGQYSLRATDTNFNVLATTPIALCNLSSRGDGTPVPNFCTQ